MKHVIIGLRKILFNFQSITYAWLHANLTVGFLFFLGNYSLAQHLQVEGHATVIEMDTVCQSPNNVVRLENGTLALKQIQIGDTAFGGIVFYVDPSGEHGLVMAESDQSDAIAWSDTLTESGATGSGVFGGASNTTIIIATYKSGNYAAKSCLELDQGGFADWYLPSFDELALIQSNLHSQGIGNLKDDVSDFYWSSSEFSAIPITSALAIQFGSLTSHAFTKTSAIHIVRAIRRF